MNPASFRDGPSNDQAQLLIVGISFSNNFHKEETKILGLITT
jgi:hypothetical protein